MPKARTVADVVLGEAVKGSRANRFADMLGIVSVIDNRARQTKTTWDDIISAPGQFDAYGKALPPGVTAYRDLAEEAIRVVRSTGPIHQGTYYATPKATKNLPKGLVQITATTGHKIFVDPMSRAIKTAQGVIKPAVDAVTHAVSATANALGLPSSAPAPTSRPSQGLGMAALAPNGLGGGLTGTGSISFRNVGQENIAPALRDALSGLSAEFGQDIGVNSGYRSPAYNRAISGAKNSLHTQGLAADIDMTGWSNEQRQKAIQELTQRGVTGFIAYSKLPDMMHVDMRQRPPGARPHFMFDKTASLMNRAPDYFKEMAELGGLKTPASMQAPQAKPNSPMRPDNLNAAGPKGTFTLRDQTFAAPVERVDRAPIGPASLRPDRPMPSGPVKGSIASKETVSQGYGQVARTMAEAGVRGIGAVPSPQRPDNQQYAGPKGNFSVPSKPSDATLTDAYGQMADTMSQVGVQGVGSKFGSISLGTQPTAPVQQPVTPQVAQPVRSPVQRPVQPLEVTVTRPQVVPVAPPPAPVAAYKAALGAAAPNALGGPSSSVFGYGGQAIDAVKGGAGWAGATAFSRSNPSVSYTALGNGMVAKHNAQYGTTSYSYGGPTTSLFGGNRGGGQASRAEADRGGKGVTAGGTGLW